MIVFRNMFALVVALLLVATVSVAPAAAAGKCLSNEQARKVIERGEAVQFSAVRKKVQGEILKARLCKKGAGYAYEVTVISKNGAVKTRTIDATP